MNILQMENGGIVRVSAEIFQFERIKCWTEDLVTIIEIERTSEKTQVLFVPVGYAHAFDAVVP